jgi:replication-associated recombination protein RarA
MLAVSKVEDWLLQATCLGNSTPSFEQRKFGMHSPPRKRLLILCGKPGTGKSTCVRVLAAEHGIELAEWNDTFGTVQTWRDKNEEPLLFDPDHTYADNEGGGFNSDSRIE